MDHADNKLIAANSAQHQYQTPSTEQPRTILEEEEYTTTLSHIVSRDYFPSLPSLRRDAAILDARSRGDISGAVAVRRAARREEMERERERAEELEAEGEAATEAAIVPHRDGNGRGRAKMIQVRKRPRPLKHESITGFHARVTSEDNAEFESNQERERKEREVILGVVYASKADKEGRLLIEACLNGNGDGNNDNDDEEKAARARALLCDTPIGLSSDLYDAPPSAGLRITNNDSDATNDNKNAGSNGIGRNGLFFQPMHRSESGNQAKIRNGNLMLTSGASSGGTFLSLENGTAPDNATTSITNEQGGRSDNLLMPPPPARMPGSSNVIVSHQQKSDGDDSAIETTGPRSTPVIDNRCQLVEYLPKPELPDIHPPATRFPHQAESRLLAIGSNGNSIVNHRSGRSARTSFGSCNTDASDTTDLDASPRPLDMERAAHQKARLRENETFVAMTPLIQPGLGGSKRQLKEGDAIESSSDEPIMTWGDVASTPLVLGGGTAVDGRASSAEWEPTRPASLPAVGQSESGLPAFDVIDVTSRETMARRAEKGLNNRAKTYRAAGSKERSKRSKENDDASVSTARSISSASTGASLNRAASLTPAARALLEASNNARKSKKRPGSRSSSSSSSSRIFQSSASASRSSGTAKIHAGSRDSFGSALRMSYTPNATPESGKDSSRKKKGSSSSMRRAAGGATPRCQAL